jgi:TatD DNase family protein
MITDTHAHLYFPELLSDIENVVSRSFDAGVTKIIAPSVDLKTAEIVLNLTQKFENIYAAVGFHPSDVKNFRIEEIKYLEDFISDKKTVAVGEIGLDYYWDKSNIHHQKNFFIEQIHLAKQYNLPIIIHTRDSVKDAIEIVKSEKADKLKGQFHCFSGDEKDLNEILELDGFSLSFCGNITYKKYSSLDLIKKIPADKILSETDSPFLTPEPFRSKKNEPARIIHTIQKIANVKEMDFNILIEQLSENTKKLFNI